MQFTWIIEHLDVVDSTGFVAAAHWRVHATDQDRAATAYGVCTWEIGDPEIPFADLTEEAVLAWCVDSGVDQSAIEAKLVAQLERERIIVPASKLPWVVDRG